MSMLPLFPNVQAESTLTYRDQQSIRHADFLADVLAVAATLPSSQHVLNLCKDRYWFAVTLFAAITRGMLSVLPNSTAAENITNLQTEFPDLLCLGDQAQSPLPALPYHLVNANLGVPDTLEMPYIPAEQAVVCVYTSGSSGKPKPHIKTFGRLQQGAMAESERMWQVTGGASAVLGTVPFQHMYGLESSILLPIWGGGMLSTRLPFFPADIAMALAELPEPRFLVTTPFHLRKLLQADISLPKVAAILSATAPLSLSLAEEAERQFGAPIVEIYGSTETGQLATRQPTQQIEWSCYRGVSLTQPEAGQTLASGGHLESPQLLSDVIELLSPQGFRLLGRHSDMINIAGKRSSLAFLNQLIMRIPGVQDGVFCLPEHHEMEDLPRLAVFVVAPELTSQTITAALRLHIDPIFLPRPIVFVDQLLRDGNGKIPAAVMKKLVQTHLQKI